MKTIKKLADQREYGRESIDAIARKVNEIINALKEEESCVLVCPYCGSEEWESSSRSTLMGGPMNYYTYRCKECGKETRVKRIERTDPRIYLGPEDEIMESK